MLTRPPGADKSFQMRVQGDSGTEGAQSGSKRRLKCWCGMAGRWEKGNYRRGAAKGGDNVICWVMLLGARGLAQKDLCSTERGRRRT